MWKGKTTMDFLQHKLAAVAVLTIIFVGCRSEEPAGEEPIRPVRAMRVADLEGITGRSFPGQAEATQEVDLAFRVAGPLMSRPVNLGDNIKKGDLIARIDFRDFVVSLRNVEANLERARASEKRAKNDLARFEEVHRTTPGAVTEQQLDRAREALAVGKADVTALEASVRAANDALNDTQLKAPFDGTIVATYVENFENVREKQMIVRLLDKTRIEFTVNIPESLISLVNYVENMRVRFDAFPDIEISAEIKEIGMQASETTRTFPVTLIMDQPKGAAILPGMAGRATGKPRPPGSGKQLDIVIPVTAVFASEDKDKSNVWVIDEAARTVARREVKIGKLVSGGYVIQSGLKAGEMIATAGVHFLKEGQQVEPQIP
jgi:RND family efflux transporter MFP subunit